MQAKQIIVDGIHFRSKLEARWYLFFKKLGWKVVYEPEIEGLRGWIPDFLIIGTGFKTLVDVKPIDSIQDWEDSYWHHNYKDEKHVSSEKIIRRTHKDYNKIMNSGIKNLPEYELLILGSNLQLDGNNGFGVLYERMISYDWDEKTGEHSATDLKDIHQASECMFVGDEDKKIGFFSHEQSWSCKITGDSGKIYKFRADQSDKKFFKKIDTMWNESWSELRWKGKEIK
tara:strand:- start:1651 stop:2334 length:684 start_codon:yes stop_codon:yes gene_type:complete